MRLCRFRLCFVEWGFSNESQIVLPHAHTEHRLVEQPAIELFAELGWQTVSDLERPHFLMTLLGYDGDDARGKISDSLARPARLVSAP